MRLHRYWHQLSTLGLQDNLPIHLRKKIILCNRMAFTTGLVIALASFAYFGAPVLFALYLLAATTYASPLYWNFRGHHQLARWVFSLSPPIFILMVSGLLADDEPIYSQKFALLSVLIAPVLLFQRSERRAMWLGIGWVALSFVLFDPVTAAIPRLSDLDSNVRFERPLTVLVNALISLVLFVAAFLYLQRVNAEQETQLAQALAKSEEQRRIIEEQNNELKRQYAEISRQRSEIEAMVCELRLQVLKAQINPHFIFNALNSIQHFVLQKDTREALSYLAKFSKLIRQTLENSVHETVSVADELKALTYYLDLERLRFDNHFSYAIETDPDLDPHATHIPSMLLQPYVENAILHGLRHKPTPGQLRINLISQHDHLLCLIEDNGVGRVAAAQFNASRPQRHVSRGTSMTDTRVRLLNRGSAELVSVVTLDLCDEGGQPRGTRVEVSVPL